MLSLIAAVGEGNRVIGNKGKLPWHIPDDLAYFREKTKGHPVILGMKTFSSIGKPLPERTNIVLSDIPWESPPGILIASSLEEALTVAESAPGSEEVFVIGGGVVYKEAIARADRLYITLVFGHFSGDVFFPEYETLFPKTVSREDRMAGDLRYSFLVLERENSRRSYSCSRENPQTF
ncbi:MAG: dihydrofolate reductase [Candidatus Moraniibacteriota bacterium]|nr:MAG: dihydrofolate reductase [Candidatus Moranbacteria bacterium]